MRIVDLIRRPSIALARTGLQAMLNARHLSGRVGLGSVGHHERAAAWDALVSRVGPDRWPATVAPIGARR